MLKYKFLLNTLLFLSGLLENLRTFTKQFHKQASVTSVIARFILGNGRTSDRGTSPREVGKGVCRALENWYSKFQVSIFWEKADFCQQQ